MPVAVALVKSGAGCRLVGVSTRRQRSMQKGKDGKRPRHFHRGRAQGLRDDRLMQETLEPAFQAAEEDQDVVASMARTHRRDQADFNDLMGQLDHVAPFAPAPLPTRLL